MPYGEDKEKNLKYVAKSTLMLSRFLGKTVDEVWEHNTSKEIKDFLTLEEVKNQIRLDYGDDPVMPDYDAEVK